MKRHKPNLKIRSSRLNFLLISISTIILAFTLVFSQLLVRQMAREERTRIQNWAVSTQRQIELSNQVRTIYAKMETEERQYAMVWSYVYEQVLGVSPNSLQDFDYLMRIISNNRRPFILVDSDNNIVDSKDPDVPLEKYPRLTPEIEADYSTYPPIVVDAQGMIFRLYFKPSDVFMQLRDVFTGLDSSFSQESLTNISAVTVPVMITNESQEIVYAYANMQKEDFYSRTAINDYIRKMRKQNVPIVLQMPSMASGKLLVFYESSPLLKNMEYFSMAILIALLIVVLGILSLLAFTKRMEQNQVWWGMSKETAHQLGTPLSSLLAWIDYYKLKEGEPLAVEDLAEIEKDVKRIELVTNRFSKIGSIPELNWENVVPVVHRCVNYLRTRSSAKVKYSVNVPENAVMMAQINAQLLEWVLENLCKNALNAIEDNVGEINVMLSENTEYVIIDVQDTGKGMPKSMFNKIFDPGFTTKTRGWGVGLTLCKRIVEDYHRGKIFVKNSVVKEGTTFRLMLNKKVVS